MRLRIGGGNCVGGRRKGILVVFDLEKANRSLSSIVDATSEQLSIHRNSGYSDEDFIVKLLKEFVILRQHVDPNAGSMHMALSCYRMALYKDYIEELEDKVSFYKDSIDMLLDVEKL